MTNKTLNGYQKNRLRVAIQLLEDAETELDRVCRGGGRDHEGSPAPRIVTGISRTLNEMVEQLTGVLLGIEDNPAPADKTEQRSFCHVCNLPTDGKKCYYKRCPVEPDKTEQR